jgi:hypothetical protein
LSFKKALLRDPIGGKAPRSVVAIQDREFFRIRSKTTHNPDLIDLVQPEHAERIIMFRVQKSVDIVGG